MKKTGVFLLALVLLLTSCAAGREEEAAAYAPEEGSRLTVYTSHKEEVYWPIVKEFEERTGVWVDVVTGGTNELLERIEGEANSPRADVMFGGGVESLESYRDCFTPYVSGQAEALQERFRSPDGLWTPFSALPVALIYNTKLVKAEQLTGWEDLLSPAFRGRIAFTDPAVSGSSFTGLVTLLDALGGGEATLSRLADSLDGRQLDSSGAVLTSVAGGSDWVGVTLEETALQRIAAGEDIALVYPVEGTSCVPDASALVKGAPHGENARRFLDFTVEADVQSLLAQRFCRRSVRSDLEPAEELTALEEISLLDYDVAWASEHREDLLDAWARELGEGGAA